MTNNEQITEETRPEIISLDKSLIERANYNSFSGTRGDISARDYEVYGRTILSWEISAAKKTQLLKKLHEKWTEILKQEAQHVSMMVAGPAKYNARKLDHSDRILRLSSEFSDWFKGLEKQVEQGKCKNDKAEELIRRVEFTKRSDNPCNPTNALSELALYDVKAFVEYYEELYPTYKWRKNSTIAKLYASAKAGTLKVIEKEVFFEDENLTAYTEGDRAYIKFLMKPKRQLIVALKSRGYWWNSYKSAWSTYLDKLDKEWVQTISNRYGQYI